MGYRFIFFDLETTGVWPNQDRIIEIAAFDPERNKTFCEFVNPQMPIPKESTAINNISDEMVKNAPLFNEVGQRFCQFCDGKALLIAHNGDSFDEPFLRAEFRRATLSWPTNWQFIDSLKWARNFRKDLPRHSLQYLRSIFGIELTGSHRALNDVLALHKVFMNLVDDLSCETVMQLLQQASPASFQKEEASFSHAHAENPLSLFS